ncbi:MAG: hypothetical protein RIS76_2757 [Verrucomicrobiota bacterium]|jgi:uncharacterized protein YdhG (YjbR/CyaY superfamily)
MNAKPATPAKPTTIDEYLAATSPAQRAVLETLRRAIHAAAPGAEEYLGYGLAGFKHGGRPLVYLGAWKEHCALYAASPKTQASFAAELKNFEVSKGSIRFTVEKPLPLTLVKRLVKARLAENAARKTAKKSKPAVVSAPDVDVPAELAKLKRIRKPRFRAPMKPRYQRVAKDALRAPAKPGK